MVCGSREAAARRRWAAIARIGYAIRKARRDRFPQLPVCTDGRTLSAGAADSTRLESSQPAEDLRGDAPVVSPRSVPPAHAEASAAPQRVQIPKAGGSLPPSRCQLEALQSRAAPALFDQLTYDGSRSAVAAVRQREWRLENWKYLAMTKARCLDVDPTVRDRFPLVWTHTVCELPTVTFADFSPGFGSVPRRAHKADGFEFSAVPFRGRWGWRKRARLLGYMGRIDYEDVD